MHPTISSGTLTKRVKVLGKIEKKKVFLHFYADWCGFCLKMAKETFRNSAVVSYLEKNFIAVRVNSDKEPDTAAKYGVMGLPSNWFLTEMGQPIGNIPGYIPPDAIVYCQGSERNQLLNLDFYFFVILE